MDPPKSSPFADSSSLIVPVEDPCHLCGQPCANFCANCAKVFYCSKAHQIQDRKCHRPECFPGIVAVDPVVGRHLVATRQILAGEVILKEMPIMSGPNGRNGLHPLCLVCYRQVQGSTPDICRSCHWPIHRECSKDLVHGGNECAIFAKNGTSPLTLREVHMYEKVLILRCLLQKRSNPEAWNQICDLQNHHLERHKTHRGQLLSRAAIEFIRRVCGLSSEEVSDLEIDTVLGVISTNAFVSEDNSSLLPKRSGSYLYYHASLPAHSCVPNGKWSINGQSKYTLRALRYIQKGESITQLYVDATIGTLERRQYLKTSKYFSCACPRCSDRIEGGSFYSAIKCLKCSSGYLLPEDPLNENSEWTCFNMLGIGHDTSTSGCDTKMTVGLIESYLAQIKMETEKVDDGNSLDAVGQLETLGVKYGAQLHPNHYLIHEIEQGILQRCSYLISATSSGGGSDRPMRKKGLDIKKGQRLDLAKKLVQLSRKSLKLLEMISPGLTIHRGRQIFFLQQGLGILIDAQINGKKNKAAVSLELKTEMAEYLQLRQLGSSILETESEVREEFILAKKMADNSDEIVSNIFRVLQQ